MWDVSKCDLCGDCLVNCRYVSYDRDKAIAEIKLLMEGKDAEVLNKCTTCMACSSYCPTGADPADLVFKMQQKIGTSPIVVGTVRETRTRSSGRGHLRVEKTLCKSVDTGRP